MNKKISVWAVQFILFVENTRALKISCADELKDYRNGRQCTFVGISSRG